MKVGTNHMGCSYNRHKPDCHGQPRMYGHVSRGDIYFQAQAGYSENTWSGREDCFRGNSCAAALVAGGGAGFLPPQQEAMASVQPPVIPAHWGQNFRGGRKGEGLLMAEMCLSRVSS